MTNRRRVIVKRVVAVVVALCIAFTLVGSVADHSWYKVAFGGLAAILLVDWLRPKPVAPEPLAPDAVPDHAVAAAIAATDSRIPAIKLLREQYPGLGLKDAKELVDEKLGA
ncbi:hypothetical protein QMK17_18100 [Rhodococcus sp. G-MC3]|uniref:hypothetical protein n=1 Tax=Rhodococcus sp. G-MC3 TaxID=3046209 RepID=UPI0024BB56B2|nr:hypothetical protein [Rhodococcus sp. G-MC3]MDJ0395242.1 hypothetical protein [Rhodococcus sp. G-MC3]